MPGTKLKPSHFKKIQNFKADYTPAEFTQYESERTGMRVSVVDRKGPKVHGYFALATEIHDDSGAPHTLEHLCFMGSRNYPYKGVLDKIATRSYSTTNAWTATDHTAYTLDTAGWEGFAQILPIYLDHVILPTLTDAGCYTEVHHVDGSGNDAGVVYSEMQGVQNTQSELMELQARRHLYPEGNGFRYETGGMMEQLRVLTAERIREFHRDMYQPKNLRLVLIGEVDHANLLEILDDYENSILDQVPSLQAPFKRPWVESNKTPPLSKTIIDTVEFPEEDESTGEVLIGFFGPECTNSIQENAMDALLIYLAESTVSVLVNTLVEKEHLASSVQHYKEMRLDTVIWFQLSGVDTDKLAIVEKRFFEVLREAAAKPLDMAYLKDCLDRFERQVKYGTETANNVFAGPIIEDHLFGNRDGSNLIESLATLQVFVELNKWTDLDWRKFMSHWLSDAHHVSILGVPSAKLAKKLKEDEQARVKAQQESLGEEGLKEKARRLQEAMAENGKEIPKEVLEKFRVPAMDSIHFFETITARSGLAKSMGPIKNNIQDIVDKDEMNGQFPLFIHFEHIPTNFVHFTLVLCTGLVPTEIKPLLSVYMNNFFTTPIIRDGKRIEFEQVVTEMEQDTILYRVDTGAPVGNSELITIKFVVEPDKFETIVKWLRDLLLNSIFDEERLSTTITKLLADIPEEKRDGNTMLYAVDNMIHYAPSSSGRAQNTLSKALYLKRTLRLLKSDPQKVISQMEKVRSSLVRFENMRILMIANLETVFKPVQTFSILSNALNTSAPLQALDSRAANLSDAGRNPGSLAYIIPMSTIDSSYLCLVGRGPDSFQHPDLPALMVALAYLEAVEGPLWTSVRGTGLAYGTGFARSDDTGHLRFRVYRSPDSFKAYLAARAVVEDFISGARAIEQMALEGAVSSIVLEIVERQETMSSAANQGFVNLVVRGVEKKWDEVRLKEIAGVGGEEIRRVLREYVLPVFMPGRGNLLVACAGIMQEDLKKNFEEVGFKPQIQPLSFFQDDYGLSLGDEEEVEADDDEDDDDYEDMDEDGYGDEEEDEVKA